MKAFTIWQPWASALALGFKEYETRGWRTNYRGWLLIHAAKVLTMDQVRFHSAAVHNLRATYEPDSKSLLEFEDNPQLGAIIADAWLADCIPTDGLEVSPQEAFFGDFSSGRFAWKFTHVRKLDEPLIWPGAQGIWDTATYLTQWPRDATARRKEAALAQKRP